MPPKKKGKKVDDDWEAELGETVPGAEATDGDATPGESAPDQNGDDAGGGGGNSLMAALQKNRNKRQKKGKHVEEIVGTEEAEPELDNLPLRPADGSKGENGVKEVPKAGAKGQAKKAPPTDEEAGKVKTKKEKEKEKKEREKQKKKEQAAKKKPTPATTSAASKDEEPETPEPEGETEAEAAAAAATKGAAAKRKIPAGLAALRKKQEELKQREEELARLNAEEKARAEEEEKRLAEEEKKKEEARARKKEKEKEKKEQLKKEGKLLTPAQKAAKERNERAREQMLASGGLVAGLQGDAAEEKKKKPVYDKKKRPTKKELDEKAAIEAAQEALRKEAEQLKRKEKEEAAEKAKKDAELAAANEESDDDVKESWDMDSDEEREHKQATAVAAATAATAAAAKRAEEESDSDSEDSEDEETSAAKAQEAKRKAEAAARRQKQHEAALAARSKDNLRSPICCILGHVDTGKTKLLDKIRQTNVQEGEAGGITQQIGATYFPADSIKQKVAVVNPDNAFEFKVPGLLVIDTPGHESFTNLRSRGSSLCNIAVLVVDIMHGLEPQTIESIKLLRDRKTPFIVALNKIDRLYGWKPIANNGFEDSLSKQNKGVHNEFRDRLEKTKVAFAEQGFNSELFFENKSLAKNVSLVPTSAHTGEGIPDMLKLLIMLTQERMTNKLMYLSEVECTVLEVKVIEGLGTTIDVVLSNGVLREGDRIVICGLQGAIATNIRALLTPPPARELRIKSQYIHHKEVKASLGVKIAANDLENAIAGSRLLVVGPDDDEEDLEEEVMSDLDNLLSRVSTTGRGVSVHASTLGSLEALLEFLRVSKIPVANISIGTVWKRDVMQAGVMLEKAKEYAVMLCFDVKVDKEAQQYADDVGIKIFTAPIIYHLFDAFTAHMKSLAEQRKEESKLLAVFPCVLSPVAVFNKKDPIVLGVDVVEGNLRLTTPVAVVKTNPTTGKKEVFSLGRVVSIERDHKQINICKRGQPSVAIKIEGPNQPGYGRQLEDKDMLFSQISRLSIDTLKEFYRDEVTNDEWLLVKKLKGTFDIA